MQSRFGTLVHAWTWTRLSMDGYVKMDLILTWKAEFDKTTWIFKELQHLIRFEYVVDCQRDYDNGSKVSLSKKCFRKKYKRMKTAVPKIQWTSKRMKIRCQRCRKVIEPYFFQMLSHRMNGFIWGPANIFNGHELSRRLLVRWSGSNKWRICVKKK